MLLYVADSLAYCPYSSLDEPLFVVHHIDMTISVSGSNILQTFREVGGAPAGSCDCHVISFLQALGGSGVVPAGGRKKTLLSCVSLSFTLNSHNISISHNISHNISISLYLSQLREVVTWFTWTECCRSSHACFLLLLLKQHLKRMYGLTDRWVPTHHCTTFYIVPTPHSKCQRYSPTESNKAYDKAVNRRSGVTFDPSSVLEELKRSPQAPPRSKEYYLQQYVEVCMCYWWYVGYW